MRLIDKVFNGVTVCSSIGGTERAFERLPVMPVFDLSPIAEWIECGNAAMVLSGSPVFNGMKIGLPFHESAFTWKLSTGMVTAVASRFESIDAKPGDILENHVVPEDAVAIIRSRVYADHSQYPMPYSFGEYVLWLSSSFNIITKEHPKRGTDGFRIPVVDCNWAGLPGDQHQSSTDGKLNNTYGMAYVSLAIVLNGLAFLSCRNVRTVEQPCSPKLAKRYLERHGHKRPGYYVLDIEPMKQIIRKESGGEPVTLAKALHICRGHFKSFDEKPLFGKLKGTYWWQPHVRGTEESGVIAKDYKIKPP